MEIAKRHGRINKYSGYSVLLAIPSKHPNLASQIQSLPNQILNLLKISKSCSLISSTYIKSNQTITIIINKYIQYKSQYMVHFIPKRINSS